MSDASYVSSRGTNPIVVAESLQTWQIRQLPDGRAAVLDGQTAAADGDRRQFRDEGKFACPKAANINLLSGGRAYWDVSERKVTYWPGDSEDYYLGTVFGDAIAADANVTVDFNCPPRDVGPCDPWDVTTVGSQAAAYLRNVLSLSLSATNEVQSHFAKLLRPIDPTKFPVVELILRMANSGSTSDVSIHAGLGEDGSATPDERFRVSLVGNTPDLLLESDDDTTSAGPTDTTVNLSFGSAWANRHEFWFDLRNLADVRAYHNGIRLLPAVPRTLAGMTADLFASVRVAKASGTATAGPISVDEIRVRTASQGSQ